MKSLQSLVLAVALCAFIGCTATQQTVTYKTLSGLEISTTGAYDAYAGLAIKGTVATNDIPAVSKAYNDFQSGMHLAVVVARNDTNALAPQALIDQSAAVINLIGTVKGK